MEPQKTNRSLLKVLILVSAIGLGGAILLGSLSRTAGNTAIGKQQFVADSQNDATFLQAHVQMTSNGLVITNNEIDDWTDCFVGVNGPLGLGFDNPPYRTHSTLWNESNTIPASTTITVPYSEMTSDDGTRFDINSHAVNTAVVSCFGSTRAWMGSND